ncbi:MAG: hypothetical protein ILP10_02510, partial [Lachnospiraceae bacterium]|nr:hypothetical protein [Lachnospiraceae bacterium]
MPEAAAEEDLVPDMGDDLMSEAEEDIVPDMGDDLMPEAEEDLVPDLGEDLVPEAEDEFVPEAEEEEYVPEVEEDLVPDMGDDLMPEAAAEEDLVPDMGDDLVPEAEEDLVPDMGDDLMPEAAEDLVPDMGDDLVPEAEEDPAADTEAADDMDDLLDSLFGDEEEGPVDAEPEETLAPDDISAIFDEAEKENSADSPMADMDDLFTEYPGDEVPDLGALDGGDEAAEPAAEEEYDLSDLLNMGDETTAGAEPEAEDPGLMPELGDLFGPEGGEPESADSDDGGLPDIGAMLDMPDVSMPDVEMQKVVPEEPLHPSDAASFGTEEDLMNAFTEVEPEQNTEDDLELIMDSISSGEFEHELSSLIPEKEQAKAGEKKKQNWFKRLFFNIYEQRTPEEETARIEKLKAEDEKKKKDAEEAKARKSLSKEEKKAKAEQDKAARAEEAAKAKAEKEAIAKEKKEAAALKAKQKKEARLAIEEYEDEGKINKAGATILVVIFAVLTVAVIIGTNIYTYNLSIQNAQTDFDRQRYNDAYYDVYGLDIKDEDIVLYDRIMTVMYVNKQLNSYNNFLSIGNTDKALDSLLKGLQRYNKYIQLASILDIVDDMNYVKNQILDELSTQFAISEAEADRLIAMEEVFDYSDSIYGLTDLQGQYDY